jgi:hypothetical protein
MVPVDVRRLAAIDMHGATGTSLRRRLIFAEFVFGAVGGLALGLWMATAGSGGAAQLVGAWVAGVGVNYVPLALFAASLSPPGALDAELAGADVGAELRRYSYTQMWIFVPLLLAVLALRQARRE